MWIWIVSLLVLIACFIFAWRMLLTNFDMLPNEKKFSMFKNYSPADISYNQETLRGIKSKLRTLEDQNAYYELQFTKLQQRLKQIEEEGLVQVGGVAKQNDGEDWKEMYYEENEKKEKLENELDATQQRLDTLEEELKTLKDNSAEFNALKSDHDARLNEIQSLQNAIGELQQQLDGAAQREKDLEVQLQKEINRRQQLEKGETIQTSLKSENEGLRRQITEMTQKHAEIEKKLMKLNELESRVAMYEEEKLKMITDLEMMLHQSKTHHQ